MEAMAYVNKQGEARSLRFNVDCQDRTERYYIYFFFFLSRQQVSTLGSINHSWFIRSIDLYWGDPKVDLFATKKNAKVPRFFSLNPGDQPLAVDAPQSPSGFRPLFCISTTTSHSENSVQVSAGGDTNEFGGPILAQNTMVCNITKTNRPAPTDASPSDGIFFARSPWSIHKWPR